MIDLRYNSGGYLHAAIKMINEFLEKGELIVYTEGRSYPREDAIANGKGMFKNVPVCVLINEWSASASEILSGALKDYKKAKKMTSLLMLLLIISSVFVSAILFIFSDSISLWLYKDTSSSLFIKMLAPLAIFIYICYIS